MNTLVSPHAPAAATAARWAAGVIALTLGLMLVLTQRAQEDLREQDRTTEMQAISKAITVSMDRAAQFALAQAEALARQSALLPLLQAEDREALLTRSRATYDYLKTQAGVSVFGFHTADMRYLLRVHKLDAFNDDISKLRPMVLAANKSRQPQAGLEMGVSGIVGVRGVAVMQEGSRLIGTAEVGVDLQPLLEEVKTSTNADVAVVISTALSGFTPGKDSKQSLFGDLMLSSATDASLFSRLLREDRIRPSREVVQSELSLDGRRHAMVVQPLVDYSGRMIGAVVALRDRSERDALIQRSRVELWVVALCGGLLAWVVLRVLCAQVAARAVRPEAPASAGDLS